MRSIAAAMWLAGWASFGTALAAAPDCAGPPPQLALEKITARAIVVGEVHGNEQTPQFVAQLVCGLLKQGRTVILALEREGQEQAALNRYLSSAGNPSDVKALTGTGAWARPFQDGRNSQAMLALIEQMRQWKQAGQRVGVLAMQLEFHKIIAADPGQPMQLTEIESTRFAAINDRTMADKLWMTLASSPAYTVVALAGNWHTAVGSKSRAELVPTPSLADVLASYVPIHVIGLKSAGGTHWIATPDGKAGPRPSIAGPLYLQDSRIDSEVDIGNVTASPPAASLARPQPGAERGPD